MNFIVTSCSSENDAGCWSVISCCVCKPADNYTQTTSVKQMKGAGLSFTCKSDLGVVLTLTRSLSSCVCVCVCVCVLVIIMNHCSAVCLCASLCSEDLGFVCFPSRLCRQQRLRQV